MSKPDAPSNDISLRSNGSANFNCRLLLAVDYSAEKVPQRICTTHCSLFLEVPHTGNIYVHISVGVGGPLLCVPSALRKKYSYALNSSLFEG